MFLPGGTVEEHGKASAATTTWLNTPPFDPANVSSGASKMDDFVIQSNGFFKEEKFKPPHQVEQLRNTVEHQQPC